MSTTPIRDGGPARGVVAVTPSDTTTYGPVLRGLFVGGAGNVAVEAEDGSTATFTGVLAGTVLPVTAARVLSTGTSATNITGLR